MKSDPQKSLALQACRMLVDLDDSVSEHSSVSVHSVLDDLEKIVAVARRAVHIAKPTRRTL
jgi:hypothetical protein